MHLATGDATGSNLAGEIEALRPTAALMREQRTFVASTAGQEGTPVAPPTLMTLVRTSGPVFHVSTCC